MGDSPRGYEQMKFTKTNDSAKLLTTWQRNDIGCPNSIPTMSLYSEIMYCVGKIGPLGNYPGNRFNGAWTIEALNWTTGETIFRSRTGNSFLYNSLYAATQIGPDKEIIYGSLGGIVRLHSLDSNLGREFARLNPPLSLVLPFTFPFGEYLKTFNYLKTSATQFTSPLNTQDSPNISNYTEGLISGINIVPGQEILKRTNSPSERVDKVVSNLKHSSNKTCDTNECKRYYINSACHCQDANSTHHSNNDKSNLNVLSRLNYIFQPRNPLRNNTNKNFLI